LLKPEAAFVHLNWEYFIAAGFIEINSAPRIRVGAYNALFIETHLDL